MKAFEIYQIKETKNGRYFSFMPLSYLKKHGLNVDLNNYDKVYTSVIDASNSVYETLDNIYTKFNVNRPSDFQGHSLSVSDIVKIDGKYYYCDDFGWEEIK